MAANYIEKNTPQKQSQSDELSGKLDLLSVSVNELNDNQENMRRMFESKLDRLKSDLIANIDTKIRAL